MIAIKATTDELSALGDALELADALINQSEYGDNRSQEATERNAVRRGWKIYTRLWDSYRGKQKTTEED